MRGDQRRVDIDDQRPRTSRPDRERPLTGLGAGRAQRVEAAQIADAIDHAPRSRVRSDPAEERVLVAQHAQVTQRVAAVGEHHRQISHHVAGIVPAATPAQPRQAGRQRIGEPEPVGDPGHQRRRRD
jgi:hypothetical protein